MTTFEDKGRYRAKIVGMEVSESQNGNTTVGLRLSIEGHLRKAYLSLSPTVIQSGPNAGKTVEQANVEILKYLGFNGDFANPAFTNGDDVEVVCKHEVYKDKLSEKFNIYLPRAASKPVDPGKLQSLNSKFRALGGGVPPPAPKVPKPQPRPTLAPLNADSLWQRFTEVWGDKAGDKWTQAVAQLQDEAGSNDPTNWDRPMLEKLEGFLI